MDRIEYIGKCLLIEDGEKKILAVGDLHLGYEEVLNQVGVFVTREMFKEMISYFDKVFDKVGEVDYIVLLGDVKHDFGRILRQELNDVSGLFDYFERKIGKRGEIVIVKGNHDIILGPIVKKREKVKIVDYFIVGECCFVHGDRVFEEMNNKGVGYWIIGHGHPAIKLGDGVKIEKYKCFLAGKYCGREIIIVPSFLEYNEGSDPRENDLGMAWSFNYDKFNVKIVGVEGDLKVLEFGRLGKIK